MPFKSYCQTLDSLTIEQINQELLKGIKARKEVKILKNIVKVDSIQLSLYKDRIVPNLQDGITKSKVEIIRLDTELFKAKKRLTFYQYTTGGLSLVSLILLLLL